jgi:IclR family transcriptional regulator, KDG regulon repressor
MDLNSTEKVLQILNAFTPYNEPVGTLELAEQLGIHRSSVSRILLILREYGFVQQDEKTKLYRLGPAVSKLGKSIKQSFRQHLVSKVQPYLLRLSEQVRESAGLVIIEDHQVFVPYRVRGPQPISVSFEHGDRGAINVNCGAKVIMAYLPQNELEEIIRTHPKLPSFTPYTITKWEDILAQCKQIRETGVAYDIEEYNLNVVAVGAAFFDHDDTPLGAITILAPAFRVEVIHDPATLDALKKTAARISAGMARKKPEEIIGDVPETTAGRRGYRRRR